MPWHDIPGNPADGVHCTITRSMVTVRVGKAALAPLNWDQDTALKMRVGTGDQAGWLRVEQIDVGPPPNADGDGIILRTAPSVLPGIPQCKKAPLLYRFDDDALEIQLPAVVARPAARPMPGRRGAAAAPREQITIVQAPPEYQQLRKELAPKGVELNFLSDGTILLNGEIVEEGEIRRRASKLIEEMAA
jgi:hypothetical protein